MWGCLVSKDASPQNLLFVAVCDVYIFILRCVTLKS